MRFDLRWRQEKVLLLVYLIGRASCCFFPYQVLFSSFAIFPRLNGDYFSARRVSFKFFLFVFLASFSFRVNHEQYCKVVNARRSFHFMINYKNRRVFHFVLLFFSLRNVSGGTRLRVLRAGERKCLILSLQKVPIAST